MFQYSTELYVAMLDAATKCGNASGANASPAIRQQAVTAADLSCRRLRDMLNEMYTPSSLSRTSAADAAAVADFYSQGILKPGAADAKPDSQRVREFWAK